MKICNRDWSKCIQVYDIVFFVESVKAKVFTVPCKSWYGIELCIFDLQAGDVMHFEFCILDFFV